VSEPQTYVESAATIDDVTARIGLTWNVSHRLTLQELSDVLAEASSRLVSLVMFYEQHDDDEEGAS
jgi:hypothetical protein